MANHNSKDDPRKNGSKTLVWRMQRGDALAHAEAVRRLVITTRQHTVSVLEPAVEAFEAKYGTPTPAEAPARKPAPARKATVPVLSVPTGFELHWQDDIPVLVAA